MLIVQKEYKIRHDWVEEVDPVGIVQEIEIWQWYQMLFAQTRRRRIKFSVILRFPTDKPNPDEKTRPIDNLPKKKKKKKKKKDNLSCCELCRLSDKITKFLDLAKEL